MQITGPDHRVALANLPVATERETQTVQGLRGEIQVAFEDAKHSSQPYQIPSAAATAPPSCQSQDDEHKALTESVRLAIKKRQKDTIFLDKVRWVVHDSKVFKTLTETVS